MDIFASVNKTISGVSDFSSCVCAYVVSACILCSLIPRMLMVMMLMFARPCFGGFFCLFWFVGVCGMWICWGCHP